ncbi:MAG: methyltransferase domain-containing protein [Cyclobacteriaceae bacterium]
MRLLFLHLILLLTACSGGNKEGSVASWDTSRIDEDYLRRPVPETMPGDRQSWQNPDLVLEKLGGLDGKVVADIGAGTGYFTFRLADRGAKVIAIDIEEDYLSYIQDQREELPNLQPGQIQTRLSEENDPLLEPNEADIVLLVNTITFLDDRVDYLEKIFMGMSDKGIICIVDYKNRDVPIISDETPVLDGDVVISELREAGFGSIEIDRRSLEFQYIITAKK